MSRNCQPWGWQEWPPLLSLLSTTYDHQRVDASDHKTSISSASDCLKTKDIFSLVALTPFFSHRYHSPSISTSVTTKHRPRDFPVYSRGFPCQPRQDNHRSLASITRHSHSLSLSLSVSPHLFLKVSQFSLTIRPPRLISSLTTNLSWHFIQPRTWATSTTTKIFSLGKGSNFPNLYLTPLRLDPDPTHCHL